MKSLLVTSEDTCVWTLAQILNDEQIKDLLSALQAQGKLKKEYQEMF
jgi:ribosome assembly protein YihI (activator of Der GTPase)